MSLPAAYAPLSMSMIIAELGYGGALQNISLSGSETGLYGTINLCSPSHPDGVSPFAISEWYSYDNNALCFLPSPTSSISSSWYWSLNPTNFGIDGIIFNTGSGITASQFQIFAQLFPTGSTLSGGDSNGPFTISSTYGGANNPVTYSLQAMGSPYYAGFTPAPNQPTILKTNADKGIKLTIQTYNSLNLTGSVVYQLYKDVANTNLNRYFIEQTTYPTGTAYLSASVDSGNTRITLKLNGCTTGSSDSAVFVGGNNNLGVNNFILVGPTYPTSSYYLIDSYGTTGTDYSYYIDDLGAGYITSSVWSNPAGTPITQFKFP
jgi:hypothetical protein